MQYSWLPQERRQIIIREKPPLIISHKRYARIVGNATQATKQEQLLRHQLRSQHDEKLRVGGEELLQQFGGQKLCITQKEECIKELRLHKEQQEQAQRQALADSAAGRQEEQTRQRERIAQAQLLLEKLRPGPRELQCAKLQSEVLRSVNAQRQVQEEFAKALQKQRELDKRIYHEQVLQGLEEAQQRHKERCIQLGEHKQALLQAIDEREKERKAAKLLEMDRARQERERNEQHIQAQLKKETKMEASRLRQRREEALASLAMSQQGQQRLQMLEEVEQVQCEYHNRAKGHLEQLKRDQARNRIQKRLQRNEQLAQQLAPRLHYSASQDRARHEKHLQEMRKAHSAEQAQRRLRREEAKFQRLAIQREEQELLKANRQRAEQERREAVELRLKNDLIHVQFKRDQRQEQLQRVHQLRQQLDKQVQERQEEEARPDTNYNREAQLECLREDAFFFDYARQLMDEASGQGCPLKPFVRAVGQYKNENRIGAEIRVPRHMVTRLTMGRRTQGDSPAEKQKKAPAEEKNEAKLTTEEIKHRKLIEENLQKIEALMLTEAKSKEEKKQGKDQLKEAEVDKVGVKSSKKVKQVI